MLMLHLQQYNVQNNLSLIALKLSLLTFKGILNLRIFI